MTPWVARRVARRPDWWAMSRRPLRTLVVLLIPTKESVFAGALRTTTQASTALDELVSYEHEIWRQTTKTLGFLVDYTETHFSTEEKHMAANNYGGLDEHKAKHDGIVVL